MATRNANDMNGRTVQYFFPIFDRKTIGVEFAKLRKVTKLQYMLF